MPNLKNLLLRAADSMGYADFTFFGGWKNSQYAERLGVEFRPHDLRRTYGKLAHKGGAKIEQIQLSYGHADNENWNRNKI